MWNEEKKKRREIRASDIEIDECANINPKNLNFKHDSDEKQS